MEDIKVIFRIKIIHILVYKSNSLSKFVFCKGIQNISITDDIEVCARIYGSSCMYVYVCTCICVRVIPHASVYSLCIVLFSIYRVSDRGVSSVLSIPSNLSYYLFDSPSREGGGGARVPKLLRIWSTKLFK